MILIEYYAEVTAYEDWLESVYDLVHASALFGNLEVRTVKPQDPVRIAAVYLKSLPGESACTVLCTVPFARLMR